MIIEPVIDFAEAVDEITGDETFDGPWFREVIQAHNIPYRITRSASKELIESDMSAIALVNGWDEDKMFVLWREQNQQGTNILGVSVSSIPTIYYTCLTFPDMKRDVLIKLITKTMSLKAFL
jgi:hypothetical protein